MSPKPDADALLPHLSDLPLNRLGDQEEAGLLQVSLPWPPAPATVSGMGGAPSWVKPIGQWFDAPEGQPRRLLITADAPAGAPATLHVDTGAASTPEGDAVEVSMELFDKSKEPQFIWKSHFLKLRHGDHSIGLALGLRHGGTLNWWHATNLVVEEESPFCTVVHMAGVIPVVNATMAEMNEYTPYGNPYLHNHNWLNGDIYARCYANGVVEIFARHTNAMYFDEGKDFEDVVPVLGFTSLDGSAPEAVAEDAETLPAAWDGSVRRLAIDGVRCDLTEVARLATPEEPGDLRPEGRFLCLQPYLGVSLYGGRQPEEVKGTPWHYKASEQIFPRGVARSLRFSLSLSDRSPCVARYLAPPWWYGANAELSGKPLLPVRNEWDAHLATMQTWARHSMVNGGFEDGDVPRGAPFSPDGPLNERSEPGWDGDVPYGQFLLSYRNPSLDDYTCAMRSAYLETDVVINHAAKMMNMHGYPPGLYALPMNRPLGTLVAYLETGDPSLLNSGEAVVETSWRTHLNSWPRNAMGRDACFLRGAVFLYRYFNNLHFKRIAHEGCLHQAHVQRPNGSFGDQAGGSGIHQWAAYISKPWMGCLGTGPILDYLDICPGEETLSACIKRFGDWLMETAWERDGFFGWSYQHDFDGGDTWIGMGTSGTAMKLPTRGQWHDNTLARILGYCTLTTGDTTYVDTFLRAYETTEREKMTSGGGHSFAAASVYLTWLQMHLWQARWEDGKLTTDPLDGGDRVPATATIDTPEGPRKVTR